MTLQQLRYFLAACRHGTFAAAADALYVSQPSVAEQIRRLEQEFGVRLFVRTGRRLELTDAGRTLERHAERVSAAVDATGAAMQDARDLAGGSASLGTFGIAQRYVVNEVVTTFVARHPDVNVRMVGRHSSEVVKQVHDGELEAGLVTLPVEDPALAVEPVMSDEILYTALPGPDLEQPMPVERLAQVRLIAWPVMTGWNDSIRRQLSAWAAERGVELTAAVEVEHLDSALALAAQGLGGTYVPRTIAESMAADSGLATVPFERPLFETYGFVWRRGHDLSRASRELIRLARQQMAGYGSQVRARPGRAPASRAEGTA